MSRNNTQALHSILFIGLLLFSWHENFYGVTSKEIQASNGGEASITSQITGGSILSTEEQKEILSIIEEITGLSEKQIKNLPDDYFPSVNGNIIHMGGDAAQS